MKMIITIEDGPDGQCRLTSEPSAKDIKDRLMLFGHEQMSPALKFGMTALAAIADANKRGRQEANAGKKLSLVLPPGLQ